jgi:transcriptional regulator with XRE-family HTH domain
VIDLAVHKAWREVRRGDDSSPEAQAYRSAIGDALALAEIRARRGLTQVDVARVLQTSQASVSKIERRDDLYLSTLRGFVEALGGRLELAAVFPEGRIAISGPREEPTSGHTEIRKDAIAGVLAAEPMAVPSDPAELRRELDAARERPT